MPLATQAAPADGVAFAEWVRPHLAVLAALAAREVGRTDADDVVQEALVRAWRRRSTFDPARGSVRGWLATIVLDKARRHRARQRPLDTPTPTGKGDSELSERVDDAIKGLPRRQREVVTLHYLLDLPVREIAAVLHITEGSVKSTLSDARNALRSRLEKP